MVLRNRKKLKVAGQKITLRPLPARKSLELVIEMSGIIHDLAPQLAVLVDKSRTIRIGILLKIVKDFDELPDILITICHKVTDIPVEDLEQKATLKELLQILKYTIKLNDWDGIWKGAMDLRIVEPNAYKDWLWSRIPDIKVS